ncbi:MAG: hypothetical protein ABSG17_05690 [Spirochaetia bacterium]|jgi:hypothetical protein
MPNRARRLSPVLLFVPVILLLASLTGCQRNKIEELVGSELFSIPLGKLENQIDLFSSPGGTTEKETHISMRDGWFYVANGNSGKVMVFSSYGDLIFLLYNPVTNPAPVLLNSVAPAAAAASPGAQAGKAGDSSTGDTVSTRGAVSYPFSDIGQIAVASDKTLYVEDGVTEARVVKDADHGVLLTRVILRFDRKGKPEGYLGQEGIGGTPFPYVMALHVTAKDQLVVVTRLPESWEVFWYSPEGTLLYRVEIDGAHLPVAAEKGMTPSLVNIIPDLQNPYLYLTIYSYREPADDPTRPASLQDDAVTSRVYRLNLRTRQYESFVELPRNSPRKETVGLKTTEIPAPPSDLIGVSANGFYYLLGFADSNLYTLQILDPSGRVRARRYMVIEDSELTFRDLRLSPTGLVYGLLVDQTKAHVTWWRSDLLLKGD